MQAVTEAAFRTWATSQGIRVGDPAYPYYPRDLSFPSSSVRRFWDNPDSEAELRALHRAAIDCLHAAESIVVWFRFRGLIQGAARDSGSRPDAKHILEPFREFGDSDGIKFSLHEIPQLLDLLGAVARFGWCVDWDAFVVPEHGDIVLFLDHHDVIWAQFKTDALQSRFVEEMAERGWRLPTDYPDATFKPQDWIGGDNSSPP